MRGLTLVRNVAAGLLAAAAVGHAQQPPGPLDRELAKRAALEQEAAALVKDAVAQGDKLARTHPDKAMRDLQRIRFALAARTDLSSVKQTELLTELGDAIARYNRAAPANPPAAIPAADPKTAGKIEQNQKLLLAAQAETKEVNEVLSAMAKDEADGNLGAAKRRLADLQKKYPHNASVIQVAEIGLRRDNLANVTASARELDRRFDKVMLDTRMTAMPALRDMEFPKNWAEITKKREELTRVRLGEEEEALLRALETRVTTPMKNQPFEEAIQSLSNAIGKNIYIDKQSFEFLGRDMKELVNLEAGVSARTALRGMLQAVGMTFVIRDKIIKVVSIEEAKKNMMTRAYDIRDVVQAGGVFNGGATWGPYLDAMQTQRNAEMLIDSIRNSIDPAVWAERQGPATITFSYATMSLIVRAPSEVHFTLGQAMYGSKK